MAVVNIGGNEYEIKLTLGAMKRFKSSTGHSLMDPEALKQMDEEKLSALIWAMIKSDLTIEQIDEMIDINDLERITSEVMAGIEESMPPTTTGK
jgi:hypothetical protein